MPNPTASAARPRAAASLRVVSMGDLLTHPFPRRDHLVFPWLRQGESALLWAQTGLGKTMLSLTLALAVAGGGEALGWRGERPRPVLYVDGEMHAEDLRDRVEKLATTVVGIDTEAARLNLHVLSRQLQGSNAVDFPDLAKPEGQDSVLAYARTCGAELVILDNFSTLAELADENDAAAMSPVLSFLLRVKAAGIGSVLVHHSGKNGQTYRGSSKLATTFEVILGLKAVDGHSLRDGAAFEMVWEKYRGKPSAATRNAEVRLVDGPDGLRWDHRPAASEDVSVLLAELRSGRHRTQRALAAALGWRFPKVTELKQRAIREGHIAREAWKELLEGSEDGSEGEPDF